MVHATGATMDDDVRERVAHLELVLGRRRRIGLVFDTTGAAPLDARHRQVWADWLLRRDIEVRKWGAGCGLVVISPALRGIFVAIFWLWNPPMPYRFFATRAEALGYVRERLMDVAV